MNRSGFLKRASSSGMGIYGNELIEPLKAISISAVVVVLLVLLALAIMLSVFGSLIFIAMLVWGGFTMIMVGVFWLVTKDSKKVQYR